MNNKNFFYVVNTFGVALCCAVSAPIFAQTLSQAVQNAITTNPDVRFQVSRKYASNERVKQAMAGYFPSLDVGAGIGRERSKDPSLLGTGKWVTLKRRDARLTLTQNLFNGFGTHHEVARTKAKRRAEAYKVSGVSEDLGLDVTEQYLAVMLEQKLLSFANTHLRTNKAILNMIRQRQQAGLVRKADFTQAKGRVALAQSNVTTQKSRLEDVITKFKRLVRRSPVNLVIPPKPNYPTLPRTEEIALGVALNVHPTLKSAKADLLSAIAQYKASKFTNWPKLDVVLNSSRGRNIGGIPGDNYDDSAMLRASYNIFRGGKDISKQREMAYKVQEAMEIKNRTELQIEESMALSWTAWKSEQERIRSLREYRDSAMVTRDSYKEQFKLGKRTLLDLLDSENEYYQARIDYSSALTNELFARYRVLNSMGKLLPYLHVTLPQAAQVKFAKEGWRFANHPKSTSHKAKVKTKKH